MDRPASRRFERSAERPAHLAAVAEHEARAERPGLPELTITSLVRREKAPEKLVQLLVPAAGAVVAALFRTPDRAVR